MLPDEHHVTRQSSAIGDSQGVDDDGPDRFYFVVDVRSVWMLDIGFRPFLVAVGLPMGQETGRCFARDLLGSIHPSYQATAIVKSLQVKLARKAGP
jgi:hypothetical protein